MKVLILSATTGGGHMRAANALKEYILAKDPSSEVRIYDTIQYVSPRLNRTITGGYEYMAKNTPNLFGGMYKGSDKNSPINKPFEATLTSRGMRLLPMLDAFRPDIVITTHSFAAEMISTVKVRTELDFPVITILTDFAVHRTYINKGINAYIVSSEEMADQLCERGIDRSLAYVYGIPISGGFLKEIDREKAFLEEGLDPELPTVLIMAGSFGVTDVIKIYHKVVKSEAEFQIIVITGKNEKVFETFEKYLSKIDINNTIYQLSEMYPTIKQQRANYRNPRKLKPSKSTKLLYFTDRVEKYMRMSDIIVTKPGGLTVTEAIATGLPIAIFKPIPGQEEQNADFLVRNGMAVRLKKDKTCTETITQLINSPEKRRTMREAIARNSNGNSAEKIYGLMLRLLEDYKKAHGGLTFSSID